MPPSPASAETNLDLLYRDTILDYARDASQKVKVENANAHALVYNTACGDVVDLSARIENDQVVGLAASVSGCSICKASCGMICTLLPGSSVNKVRRANYAVKQMIITKKIDASIRHTDFMALAGAADFPARVRCALLPWEALEQVLKAEHE